MITISCTCGATGHARYGAAWRCAACGTRWRTEGEDYRAYKTELRKIRLLATGGLIIAAACAALTAGYGTKFLLSGLIAFALYYIAVLPIYRRRLRTLYANLPQWRLKMTE